MLIAIIVIVVILVVGGLILMGMYNGLVKGRFRVKEA